MFLEDCVLKKIDELKLGSMNSRNKEISIQYFAFDGNPARSMSSVGKQYGISRQRVLETIKVFKESFASSDIDKSLLLLISKEIEKIAPCSEEELVLHLMDKKYIRGSFGSHQIYSLFDIIGIKKPEAEPLKFHDGTMIIRDEDKNLLKLVLSEASKILTYNGIADVKVLCNSLSDGVNDKVIAKLTSALPNLFDGASKFRSSGNIYFHLGSSRKNKIIDKVFKIFTCYESVDLDYLKESLNKKQKRDKKDDFKMSKDVVVKFLDSLESIQVDKVQSVARMPSASPQYSIAEFEKKVINVILESPSKTIREKELEDILVKDDIKKKFSLSMVLSYSPLIGRKSRGLYELIGASR